MSQRLSVMMSSSSEPRWVLTGYLMPSSFWSRYWANTSTWRASSTTCVAA